MLSPDAKLQNLVIVLVVEFLMILTVSEKIYIKELQSLEGRRWFKYIGNLSEKWNLEEKSKLLKFLEILWSMESDLDSYLSSFRTSRTRGIHRNSLGYTGIDRDTLGYIGIH